MIREFCGILRGSNLPQILVVTIHFKAYPALQGSETVLDSELQAVDSGFFLSVELGFWIP